MRLSSTSSRAFSSGARRLDELVEGALGVEHHRPQLALHLDPRGREQVGVDERGLVAELLQPERVGQPLGRVDRHHRDLAPGRGERPWRCAAEVVVLPTPPEPPQITMRLPAMPSATFTARAPAGRRARRARSRSSSGANKNGSRTGASPNASRRRRSCGALLAGAHLLGQRGPQGRAGQRAVAVDLGLAQRLDVAGAEALRVAAVGDDAVDAQPGVGAARRAGAGSR